MVKLSLYSLINWSTRMRLRATDYIEARLDKFDDVKAQERAKENEYLRMVRSKTQSWASAFGN